MRVRPCRKFTLVDAIVFVVATTVPLTVYDRSPFRYFFLLSDYMCNCFSDFHPAAASLHCILGQLQTMLSLVLPLLGFWTFALAVLRLLPPRPRLRKLARQPGTVACWVALFVLFVETAPSAVLFANLGTPVRGYGPDREFMEIWRFVMGEEALRYIVSRVGFAVAAAWLTLALGGRCRAAPDWIERMGRVVGTIWIGLIPLFSWAI